MAQNQQSHLHRYHPFANPMGQRIFPFALNGVVAARQGFAILVVIQQVDIYLRALQRIGDLIHSRLQDKVLNQFL
jgi:hypothetical protein